MKNPIDFIYKLFFFPWVLYVLIMSVLLVNAYLFHSENTDEAEVLALSIFLITAITVIRFTYKSWNYVSYSNHTEILLDEFESEVKSNPISKFPDYKVTFLLSILTGVSSTLLAVWMHLNDIEFGSSTLKIIVSILLKFVLFIFGLLLVIRVVSVWNGFLK